MSFSRRNDFSTATHTHARGHRDWTVLFRSTYRAIDAAHLRVYLVLEGGQVGAQNANLLARASAEERRNNAEGQTEPRRSVDDESLVATLDVVQPGKLRRGLGVLLDLARERLSRVTKKKEKIKKKRRSFLYQAGSLLNRYSHIPSYSCTATT